MICVIFKVRIINYFFYFLYINFQISSVEHYFLIFSDRLIFVDKLLNHKRTVSYMAGVFNRFYKNSDKIASHTDRVQHLMTYSFTYVKIPITSYYLSHSDIIIFIKFLKDNTHMIQQLSQNLKQVVPYYEEAADFTAKTCSQTFKTVSQIQTQVEKKVRLTKKNVLNLKQGVQNQILILAEQATNQVLTRTEKLLLPTDQRPTETEKKQIKKRFIKIFNRIMNDYVIFYTQEAKNYNMALIKKGEEYVHTYIFPMYIKLKATLIISKQIMIELLESSFTDMKMTYTVSKDTVTMLIGGKFDQEKIMDKINSGMENFKEFTVKVVKRGLQIKVDKESLYQNYELFSLKILETIKEMREKGAERIVSVKQKTNELYMNVLRRIREKEISLKMEYKQIQDRKETVGQCAGQRSQ